VKSESPIAWAQAAGERGVAPSERSVGPFELSRGPREREPRFTGTTTGTQARALVRAAAVPARGNKSGPLGTPGMDQE